MSQIRTRLAPSPTGKLHIGTARTALFNYLFAKKNNGEFVLRFEDTDQERSTKESEKDIEDGLKWLGLNWDNKPVYQMQRLDLYKKELERLKKLDLVYENDGAVWVNVKKAIEDLGIPHREVIAKQDDEMKKSFLVEMDYKDLILGKISGNVEDFVIIRSNGIPTFHFAVVVDDEDMKISHVIRGADHFANTPKHIILQKLLGYNVPEYAHIPLTLNPDGSKLSKRSGAVSVSDFKEQGYLPEALINFMVLLGWHPGKGEEREIYIKGNTILPDTMEPLKTLYKNLIQEFTIERVSKSNAIFDYQKLDWFNSWYIKNISPNKLQDYLQPFLEGKRYEQKLFSSLLILSQRGDLKKLSEFYTAYLYFFEEPKYDPQILIFKKSDKEKTIIGLKKSLESLESQEKWPETQEKFEEILKKVIEENNLSFGDVFWPIRVALSGLEKSPSPIELLWALGKEESLERIDKALKFLES